MRVGLFGLPGAGKGTQAEQLAKHWQIPHISTGELFRAMRTGTSPLAIELKAILDSGQLVPDEMVTKLCFERLSQSDCDKGFILDGYPRTLAQVQALQASRFKLHALICLDVKREEIIRRLSARRVCEQCKSVYSLVNTPDLKLCPNDKSPLVQRPDDTVSAVMTRLALFEENYLPVIRFFDDLGLLYHVDGDGPTEVVFKRLNDVKFEFEV